MELKLLFFTFKISAVSILIVPDGIETFVLKLFFSFFQSILIVPDGIETAVTRSICRRHIILIVPDGIETPDMKSKLKGGEILIVPDGIETRNQCNNKTAAEYFNRTRWN